MKRIVTGAVVASVVALGIGAVTGPASAVPAGCASSSNYKKVKNGMTTTQVAAILGSNGKLSISMPSLKYVSRDYKTCSRWSIVSVTFTNGRVSDKMGIFV
jgi:hypothetical protein